MDLVDEGEGRLPASQGESQIATGEGPPASQGGSQITGSAPSWGRGRGAASLLKTGSRSPVRPTASRGGPFTTAYDEGIGERAASLLDGLQSASQWLTAPQSRLFTVDGTAHGGSDAERPLLS